MSDDHTRALIFNSLSKGLADEDRFVPLSERERITDAIYAAVNPVIDEVYRGGYRTGQQHGYSRGHLDGVTDHLTSNKGGTTS